MRGNKFKIHKEQNAFFVEFMWFKIVTVSLLKCSVTSLYGAFSILDLTFSFSVQKKKK